MKTTVPLNAVGKPFSASYDPAYKMQGNDTQHGIALFGARRLIARAAP
jgi:hypothetical protein